MSIPPPERAAQQGRRRRALDAARQQLRRVVDVAPKPGRPTKSQGRPLVRKTRSARCGVSRPMDEPERCAEAGDGQ
jgi:hypothetical protein